MKRLVMVIISSMLLVAGSVEFGMTQTSSKTESLRSDNKVGWKLNSGKLYLDISLRSGYLHGDSTYHISFSGGASQLEFPLKTYLLGPEIGWGYKNIRNQ
ncbi:MAG: hypothetical protein AB1638_13630, partial [Nitrospirota bacterium]